MEILLWSIIALLFIWNVLSHWGLSNCYEEISELQETKDAHSSILRGLVAYLKIEGKLKPKRTIKEIFEFTKIKGKK